MSTIIYIFFNRPDKVKQSFQVIKKQQPKELFLVSDGARKDELEEHQKVLECRKYIESQIDWDCQVFKKYRDENAGCAINVSEGITWAFDHVDRAIILEDDCLVDESFFPYCNELLEKYQDEPRVFNISACNFLRGKSFSKNSYYFSRYMHCWGWATWADRWKNYQHEVSRLEFDKLQCGFDTLPREKQVEWKSIFTKVFSGEIDTWDYRWVYHCWLNNGLTILPNTNLMTNIGFDEDATHTTGLADLPKRESLKFPLIHPKKIKHNRKEDHFHDGGSTFLQTSKVQMKKIVKEFIPPIVGKAYRKFTTANSGCCCEEESKKEPVVEWHSVRSGILSGYLLRVNENSNLFSEMLTGSYDTYFWNFIDKLALEGKTILDIGGHVGYHAMSFARLAGSKGKVYSFEPNPFNRDRFKQHLEKNKVTNVEIVDKALSNQSGSIEFSFSNNIDDETSAGGFIKGSHVPLSQTNYEQANFKTEQVETLALDAFILAEEPVALMKIDVEGAEGLVLEGAKETITRHRPHLLIEVHSILAMLSVSTFLSEHSYKIEVLEEASQSRCFIGATPR